MDYSTKIKHNTIYNIIKSVATIIFPLITFPYISRVLGADGNGKIDYSTSIVNYVSLVASLGISTYSIRQCALYRDDEDRRSTFFSQILIINTITTFFAFACLIIALFFSAKLQNYIGLICILSINVVFCTLGADWINTVMEDFKVLAIRYVFFQVFSIILMFLFVRTPDDYYKYAIILVIASSGANLFNIFYRRRYVKFYIPKTLEIKKHLKPILSLFSLLFMQTIFTSTDITILGFHRDDVEIGCYGLVVKIYRLANMLVASVAWVVLPGLASAFSELNDEKIKELLNYGVNFIVILGCPIVAGMVGLSGTIIYVIGGSEFLPATGPQRVLALALFFSFFSGAISNMIFIPLGKENISIRASVWSAMVNLALNIILIPKFGMMAAALTTAIAEGVGFAVQMRYLDKKYIEILNLKMFIAPLVGSVSVLIFTLLVSQIFEGMWVRLFVGVLCSALIYAVILTVMKDEFFFRFISKRRGI